MCTSADIKNELLVWEPSFCTIVPLFHGWFLNHFKVKGDVPVSRAPHVTLDLSHIQSSAAPRESDISDSRISWMAEHGRLEAKENGTEDRVPTLTAVELFTGYRRHVHARCSLFMRSGCRKTTGIQKYSFWHGITEKHLWFSPWKKTVILCIFLFCFIVQTFCNKTRWNCSKNDYISCWWTFPCLLIGTENVKQKPHCPEWNLYKCVWQQGWRRLMRNKWTTASECSWDCSNCLWLFRRRSEHAPYVNVSTTHCTITKRNQSDWPWERSVKRLIPLQRRAAMKCSMIQWLV